MVDLFLSYKSEEHAVAERLAGTLEHFGYSVWWDVQLLSGDEFRAEIREMITQSKAVIVLWSQRSVKSRFVTDEANLAQRQNKSLPVMLEDCELPLGLGGNHADNLSDWEGEATHPGFRRLLGSIENLTGRRAVISGFQTASQSQRAEMTAFQAAARLRSVRAWQVFLADYPGTTFRGYVEAQLEDLTLVAPVRPAVESVAPSPPPANPPVAQAEGGGGNAAEPPPGRPMRNSQSESAGNPSGRWRAWVASLVVVALGLGGAGWWFLPGFRVTDRSVDAAPSELAPAMPETAPANLSPVAQGSMPESSEPTINAALPKPAALPAITPAPDAEASRAVKPLQGAGSTPESPPDLAASGTSLPAFDPSEEKSWMDATVSNTVAAYEAFLGRYPSGKRAAEAQQRLSQLRIENEQKLAAVQAELSRRAAVEAQDIPAPKAAEPARIAYPKMPASYPKARGAGTSAFPKSLRFSVDTARSKAAGSRSVAGHARNFSAQAEAEIEASGPSLRVFRVSGWEIRGKVDAKGKIGDYGVAEKTIAPNVGRKYQGQLLKGAKEVRGYGVSTFSVSARTPTLEGESRPIRYEGEHALGLSWDGGVMVWENGARYEGLWFRDMMQGWGVYTYVDGSTYEGRLEAGVPDGPGALWLPDGSLLAAGNWSMGKFSGLLSE